MKKFALAIMLALIALVALATAIGAADLVYAYSATEGRVGHALAGVAQFGLGIVALPALISITKDAWKYL